MKNNRLSIGEVVESDRDKAQNEAMRLLEEQERIHAEQAAIAAQSLPQYPGA